MRKLFYPSHTENLVVSWSSIILRVVFGGSMVIGHGWRKFLMITDGDPIKFADPIGLGASTSLYLAVFAEVICAVLLVFGLFTRGVVVPLLITMLIALLIVHGSDPFAKQEMSLLYASVYFTIFLLGPGRYSLDHLLFKSKRQAE